jgi:hypothetical protein
MHIALQMQKTRGNLALQMQKTRGNLALQMQKTRGNLTEETRQRKQQHPFFGSPQAHGVEAIFRVGFDLKSWRYSP